jgi:hypothetical protein
MYTLKASLMASTLMPVQQLVALFPLRAVVARRSP